MCLKVYTNKSDIPSDIPYISYNDLFFNSQSIPNTELGKKILKEIDKAEYSSPDTFIGRDKDLGKLNKTFLSTGSKTLLNIINNPDKCFDVIECGQNCFNLIPLITEGIILWTNPTHHYVGKHACDIEVNGKRFKQYRDFLHYVMDEVE